MAIWKHYLGLLFFIGIVVSFLKNPKVTIVTMGAYLLLASLNVIALTPSIMTTSVQVGPITSPAVQLKSCGLFFLYFLLNMNPLINIYLDYKGIEIQEPGIKQADTSRNTE